MRVDRIDGELDVINPHSSHQRLDLSRTSTEATTGKDLHRVAAFKDSLVKVAEKVVAVVRVNSMGTTIKPILKGLATAIRDEDPGRASAPIRVCLEVGLWAPTHSQRRYGSSKSSVALRSVENILCKLCGLPNEEL